ncbi:uncharacterized protein MAM_04758 [Metarhizium album ARSEF 1941]|uniref:Uncharacterized protein n=1 Tax=Metarhizium album (strain ARSEF 1941) TaxID=1081103 RepID=A0A0B2WM77_METAS|nr:uncharacterized protein MAM_04758 [Metarhizium album ARSEF 1941]KHN97161.1 hypothetical protein MAM_04758 [Metarhizium album ARSEF 1941]
MPGLKVSLSTGLAALLGALVTGGIAESGGALFVSMNYCSVVMNTQCHVSVMTSAPASDSGPGSASTPAPQPASGSAPAQSAPAPAAAAATETSRPVEASAAVASVVPISSRASVPAPAAAGSTEAAVSIEAASPSQRTSEIANSSSAVTRPSYAGSTAFTGSTVAAAAGGAKAPPAVIWGAAFLAVATLL